MTREEQLACLKDRPCDVCKMQTDKGCSSWECVFEQAPEDENICNREQEPVLDKIRAEIESNMESIVGKYDSSIPKSNMPSYKIERNKVRKECISIIDKYKAESEGKE